MNAPAIAAETTQYLSFFVGDEEYGLGILEAREIVQYPTVTKVPSMPKAIRGVVNLRGSVVPVVDLSVLFGLPERPTTKWSCVVVVKRVRAGSSADELIGIVVDSVSQVIELGAGDVEPPPAFGTRVRQSFLKGMGKAGKAFVMLLDLGQVLEAVEAEHAALPTATADAAATPATASAEPAPPEGAPSP